MDYVFDCNCADCSLEHEKILMQCGRFNEAVKIYSNGKKEYLYGGDHLNNDVIYQTVTTLLNN